MKFLLFLFGAAIAAAQPRYDILLKGGHVIDAKNGINEVRDVAIAGNRIAAVAADIPAAQARLVVDVSSLYVTPGLIDMHVHVFAGTMGRDFVGERSIRPDGFTFRSGVTTVVDAGSSGWRNFTEFKAQIIDRSQTRVLAMLNIVGHGMGGRSDVEQNTGDMEPERTAEVARQFKDIIVGVKTAHFAGREWTAVDRAVEAGRLAGVPVMIDFGTFHPERPYQELVLKKLRPGDISTHTFLRLSPMLDENRRLQPFLLEAQKRGVRFDVGHGSGSFSFPQAVPAMQQGFLPDTISTDLHVSSMNVGMKDMLNVMSKFLAIGMALDAVVARATWAPAQVVHHEELGHLSPDAVADVTVLRLQKGDFGFVDSGGLRMRGTSKLVGELTIRDGKVVWDLNGITRPAWDAAASRRP